MKNIIVPTDFSVNADNALAYATDIAMRTGAKIILLHVYHFPAIDVSMPSSMLVEMQTSHEAQVQKKLKEYKKIVSSAYPDISFDSFAVLGFLLETISELSNSLKPDLIVMGTQGASGLQKILIGSNTAKVMEKADCPVLVVPSKAAFKLPMHILYLADLMGNEESIVSSILDFASFFKAKTIAAHIKNQEQVYISDSRNITTNSGRNSKQKR